MQHYIFTYLQVCYQTVYLAQMVLRQSVHFPIMLLHQLLPDYKSRYGIIKSRPCWKWNLLLKMIGKKRIDVPNSFHILSN